MIPPEAIMRGEGTALRSRFHGPPQYKYDVLVRDGPPRADPGRTPSLVAALPQSSQAWLVEE